MNSNRIMSNAGNQNWFWLGKRWMHNILFMFFMKINTVAKQHCTLILRVCAGLNIYIFFKKSYTIWIDITYTRNVEIIIIVVVEILKR